MGSLRKLWADQRGNAAIIFGFAAIPLIALSGGAVDLTHRGEVRSRVQSASDTAALAAARAMQAGQLSREMTGEKVRKLKASAKKQAEEIFQAALAGSGSGPVRKPKVEIAGGVVTVSASLDVETSFLKVLGIEELPAHGLAEVKIPDPTLVEIALVLDYSGSMRDNDKYIRMTEAAQNFIDKVAADRGDSTKIGIVPFSEFVYATLPGDYIRDTPQGQANASVTACLLNRGYPYSVSDDRPRGGQPGSQWPQADPAVADCSPYAAGGLQVRELTTEFAVLRDALGAMQPVGLTNIALAAEMGWHLLSPGKPFDTGRDYSDPIVRKVMILLTDGMQTVNAMGPNGGPSTLAADEATAELCDNADDAGIRIFTIAYDIEGDRVRNLLSGCASNADAAHEAQGSDIGKVFDAIYAQISESVWLSR